MSEFKPYRPCVGLLVINKKGLIFIGQRIDNNMDAWQMPQGGIEEGENIYNAGLREMKEEIGTDNVKLIGEMKEWVKYDIPNKLGKRLWNGKYRGQKQKWLAYSFLGSDNEININTKVPEFQNWKWEKAKNLPEKAVPFKRNIYETVIEYFSENLK